MKRGEFCPSHQLTAKGPGNEAVGREVMTVASEAALDGAHIDLQSP
jgi:hypothetical protein